MALPEANSTPTNQPYSIVGFNVPHDTLGHFGDNFKSKMTNQQRHSTEGRRLVNHVEGQSHQAQLTNR